MSLGENYNFSYDGLLVFNGIYTTSVLDSDFDFESTLSDDLVTFEEGTYDSPGRGYQVFPFEDLVRNSGQVSREVQQQIGDIEAFRFREEEWDYNEVDQGGTVEKMPTKEGMTQFDGYWSVPDYMFIKGNKSQADYAKKLLNEALSESLKLREIKFDPEFLLWIFSKEKNSEPLPLDLSVNMLTDARIQGTERDQFGKEQKVDDSTDITQSAHILISVLRQKGLVALEGVFGVGNRFVRARVSREGRVHIKAEHAIKEANELERMALSISFLSKFSTLYHHWKGLSGEEKHPPIQFFKDIFEECKKHGVEITFSIDDVIEEYRNKGSGEEYEQRQTGLKDWT